MKIDFPYGRRKLTLDLPDEKLKGEFGPAEREAASDPVACIERALARPIGSRKLEEIVSPGCTVAISIEDVTRQVPSRLILPPLLKILRDGGVRNGEITIIVATGLHREASPEEMGSLVGDVPSQIAVKNHRADRLEELTHIGATSQGTPLYINRAFAEADVKIVTGDVEFHQITGYGGGAKSILPGLCDAETIRKTHSRLDEENASAGILERNPVRTEIDEAGRMVGVDFSLNVVLSPEGEIIEAFCGDIVEAFRAAVRLVDELYGVDVPQRYGMVIADCGGYPRDVNLYQAQKAVENAVKMVRPGGKVVLIAECAEGWGSKKFRRWAAEVNDLQEVEREMKRYFRMGYHKLYWFALERRVAELYLISELRDPDLAKFIAPIGPGELPALMEGEEEIAILHHGHNTLPRVHPG